MPIDHACFLSYRGISSEPYKAIVEAINQRLTDELRILIELDEPVFFDWKRFQPGELANQNSAHALFRSLCMVVLFVPRYFKSLHCAQEYKAMENLERERLAHLGPQDEQQRLIFPVIIRGANKLPDYIRLNSQCIYMDDLSTSGIDDTKIIKLAQRISDRYEAFSGLTSKISLEMSDVTWPSKEDVDDLVNSPEQTRPLFPGYRY